MSIVRYGPKFIELYYHNKSSRISLPAKYIFAHVPFVTGILLIFAKQKIPKQTLLELYEIIGSIEAQQIVYKQEKMF